MKKLILPLTMCVFLFGCPTTEEGLAAENPTRPAWLKAGIRDAKVVRVPADTAGELTAFVLRKGPTLRERRAMGVTYRNVRRILVDMQKAGELEDVDSTSLAVLVSARLVEDQPQAFGDPALDWDRIWEILERIIEFVLKFISIFS